MAYTNKNNVNTLTALLVAHGVRHAVCCPGSRNAPIVHNLNECPDIECFPVTDERSAGFYALGMAQCTGEPVAVCVTSGTALLNLAPAVAEAFYQHVPLVVISADRPPQWIDQLDGQTLPQTDALGRFVRKAVTLPEWEGESEQHWYCNRLVNEALLAAYSRWSQPVHINVPLTEPLFDFNVEALPDERAVGSAYGWLTHDHLASEGSPLYDFWKARRPMIVVGQNAGLELKKDWPLWQRAVVLHESIGCASGSCLFDEVLASEDKTQLKPDFVLYGGGTLVSKRLKAFLRSCKDAVCWEVSKDGTLHDTFMNADGVLEGDLDHVLELFNDFLSDTAYYEELYDIQLGEPADASAFVGKWNEALNEAEHRRDSFVPPYSQMAAVRSLEAAIQDYTSLTDNPPAVHYANSMAVRLANIYSKGFVWCNRGVNGIEGSLSTAAGFSCVTDRKVVCVLGDLSFFYDQNALWNQNLRGNLRILLLNNGGGGIFEKFEGLKGSPARERFVMASHQTTAAGICQSYGVAYREARNVDEMAAGINWLVNGENEADRPMLLEVFTDSAEDMRAFSGYAQNEK